MNSRGDVYEGPPRSAEDIEVSEKPALSLKNLNRRARLAFYCERRRGRSEVEALAIAEAVHLGRRR